MRFFEIQGKVRKIDLEFDTEEFRNIDHYLRRGDFSNQLYKATKDLNRNFEQGTFLTIAQVSSVDFSACALIESDSDLTAATEQLLKRVSIYASNCTAQEVDFDSFRRLLCRADRNCFIEDDNEILISYGLDEIYDLRRIHLGAHFDESIIEPSAKKTERTQCARLLTSKGLQDEIARIEAARTAKNVFGHPVHYIIQTNDKETRQKTLDLLLSSLLKNNRISNRRICNIVLDCTTRERFTQLFTDKLFSLNKGGAIVASFNRFQNFDSDRANNTLENIETLCESVKKYRNDVLVVLLLPKECTRLKDNLFEKLGCLSFVEIEEVPADTKRAKRLLRTMAKDKNIPTDDELYAKVETDKTYLIEELRIMFNDWFNKKLRKEVYPQYAQFQMVKMEEVKEEARGTAYDELMGMIGLNEAKKIINQAIDFHKMQKFLAAQDITRERPSQHMIFTGNPGTAKTTVARLFARIMRENELLSSGHIIEVGRADLVGKYVGHTAPLVKRCFERAQGGVLFIDEAYSLVEDRDGCFGDEAINTIVQEMENHRDSVVVIFAGYPDKMEQFLQKNPGLRSRIAFHVRFPDYTTEELSQIASIIASKKGMTLSSDAASKLSGIFDAARKEEDFGNGRYARSLIEKAIMAQSSRIINQDLETLNKTELNTLCAEDIDEPTPAHKKTPKLGFCA
ncbi:AAA family ATPase [Anaerotardibacter muris]|uniref:AAA family ATPase n=1 Tax=Anaerotardibacter muris TaxID=2941505 RepID=UPI00203EA631|nr:AAA family ATPase [Anaerotardibacter muris]